ncbi:MAG TPA: histidine kinase [Gemmatimonadaceae bacterium]
MPESSRTVRQLWWTFTFAWLLVLVITVAPLFVMPMSPGRRAMTLTNLALIAGVYLRLTLSAAPRSAALDDDVSRALRGRVAGVVFLAVLVIPLVLLMPAAGMWWHVSFAVVAAGLLLPLPIAGTAILVFVAAALAGARLVTGTLDLRLLIELAIGGAAMAVRHLTIIVDELRAAREELAHRAADAERLRIARDLHDLLGHSLSLIALKSELAGRVLPTDPTAAAREISDIERSARRALRQVRDAVAGYRQPTLYGELSAARELLAASGIRLSVRAATSALPPTADGLLAWTVREGVTNVIRHSRASSCSVSMQRSATSACVGIEDDGEGMGPSAIVEGSGLAGLRERCAALGASLETQRLARGFALSVDVPLASGSERER